MTFLLQLRNAAKECPKPEYRELLRLSADELAGRLAVVAAEPTKANMEDLNGSWAKAHRLLANVPPEGDPAPLGRDTEVLELKAA